MQCRAGLRLNTSFYNLAESCVFNKQSLLLVFVLSLRLEGHLYPEVTEHYLPSSFSIIISNALVFSTYWPVAVYSTVTFFWAIILITFSVSARSRAFKSYESAASEKSVIVSSNKNIDMLVIRFCCRRTPKTPFNSTLLNKDVENLQFSATMIRSLFMLLISAFLLLI